MDSWRRAAVCDIFVLWWTLLHMNSKRINWRTTGKMDLKDLIASHATECGYARQQDSHFFRNVLCRGLCKHPFRRPRDDTSETYAIKLLCLHNDKTFVVTLYLDVPLKTIWVIASCSDLQERLKRQDSSSWKNEYSWIIIVTVLKCWTKSDKQQVESTLLSCLNSTCAQIWQECNIGPMLKAIVEQHWTGILWKQCRYDLPATTLNKFMVCQGLVTFRHWRKVNVETWHAEKKTKDFFMWGSLVIQKEYFACWKRLVLCNHYGKMWNSASSCGSFKLFFIQIFAIIMETEM